ncbi:MAG: hypothetical protein ACKVQT_26260 [Burkholderiales bacterium]
MLRGVLKVLWAMRKVILAGLLFWGAYWWFAANPRTGRRVSSASGCVLGAVTRKEEKPW